MTKIKVSEATNHALDYLVAKCEGLNPTATHVFNATWFDGLELEFYRPSVVWAQGGPIIAREGVSWHCGNKSNWHAYGYGSFENIAGPTPLIAAMRCYVASKLGDEAEVPDELVEGL